MNYRHHYHAGNFADVMKHILLVGLFRAMQKKPKGFLYLDTHAGRGRYDLAEAATGDSQARVPEWPQGIGRLGAAGEPVGPGLVAEYLGLVRACDRESGNLELAGRFYPGSPWLARRLQRPVDRLVFCERHAAEFAALRSEMAGSPGVALHAVDGYGKIRALLPPPERRALVLMDPPFEAPDEFAKITAALGEGLVRLPGGVFGVWYPLTVRARVEDFFSGVRALRPPATLACELVVAGEFSALKMRGCGLLVINPPWQFEQEAVAVLASLTSVMAQDAGAGSRVEWVVREQGLAESIISRSLN